MRDTIPIRKTKVSVLTVPTDSPEADGTFSWNSTTMVLVEISAGNQTGIGYTYASEAAATLIEKSFSRLLETQDALANTAIWACMRSKVRNIGRPGIASMAISAVDNALWDLKAKLLGAPLAVLLGKCRDRVDIYGSGGFTSYSIPQLQKQLGGWAARGIRMVKMNRMSNECAQLAMRLGRRSSFSSTLTARTRGNKLSLWQIDLRTSTFAGLKSRSRPTISMVCALCAIARRLEWKSPPVSTDSTNTIFAACSKSARSMSYKPMPRAAKALLAS